MENGKGVVSVSSKHIEAGIIKYGGIIDDHLVKIIKSANFLLSTQGLQLKK